jgi:hypothetical protein
LAVPNTVPAAWRKWQLPHHPRPGKRRNTRTMMGYFSGLGTNKTPSVNPVLAEQEFWNFGHATIFIETCGCHSFEC